MKDNYKILETIPTKIISGASVETLNVPVYSLESVPEHYCARYVRLAAKELFDKNYPEANAWELRDKCNIVTEVNGNKDLVSLVEKNILEPGMVVGLFNPDTKHKLLKQPYTHVAIYLGKNSVLKFAEQLRFTTQVSDIKYFNYQHLQAKEVLDVMK